MRKKRAESRSIYQRGSLNMKKQIYGIVLFVVIVSFSVSTYEFLMYLRDSDCASAQDEKCAAPPEPYVFNQGESVDYAAEDVVVRVEYAEASMKARAVKTRLKLEWQGSGEPPASVWVQIQFHNFDGSSAGWLSEPVRVSKPFENSKVKTAERVFDCERCNNLSRNLYATANVWGMADVERKLLYPVKDMKPVVVQE
jgi:hypothetical protein